MYNGRVASDSVMFFEKLLYTIVLKVENVPLSVICIAYGKKGNVINKKKMISDFVFFANLEKYAMMNSNVNKNMNERSALAKMNMLKMETMIMVRESERCFKSGRDKKNNVQNVMMQKNEKIIFITRRVKTSF